MAVVITVDVDKERERIKRARQQLDEDERALDALVGRYGGPVPARQLNYRIPKGLTAAVRFSVAHVSNNFTVRDVESFLAANGYKLPEKEPRSRIAMVFKKLREREVIDLITEGRGSDPSVYKVAGT